MGNWRRVQVDGTIDEEEVSTLIDALDYRDHNFLEDEERAVKWGPLAITNGMAGLGEWPSENFSVVGNLAERNYSVQDVADHCREILEVAPSLEMKIHCGADRERDECIATITVSDEEVDVGEPERKAIPDISEDAMMGRMFKQLT